MDSSQVDTADKKKGDLSIQLGRPTVGALGSFDQLIKDKLVSLREQHEQWGAQTLYIELQNEPSLKGLHLPKPSTIHTFLSSKGLITPYQKRRPLPTEGLYQPTKCHEIWQVDGKGNEQVNNIGTITWLNIKDVFSRLYVISFPAELESKHHHPTRIDYQCALRLGFYHRGLPEKIQCDHASAFHENKSKSPFPTLFHLWLIALDIKLIFSRVHRPTDQGQVERTHRTVSAQINRKDDFDNWESLYDYTCTRLKRLNEAIPCASLQHCPPLVAYPKAKHSGRFYVPQKEEQLLNLERVYHYLEQQEWFRTVSSAKTICLGGQIYYLSNAQPKQLLAIQFKAEKKELLFYDDKEQLIGQKQITGIQKDLLMGQPFSAFQLSSCQLSIPFDWEHRQLARLF